MLLNNLGLDGVFEIIPKKHGDDRGFFSETYNIAALTGHENGSAALAAPFVQDNHSFSAKQGVLRGMHYQLQPRAQVKLVRVVRGAILDVVVDIRRSSPTFGKWVSLVVSREKWNQIWVPAGFAHGFVTLEDNTEVVYKVTDTYSPAHDRSIRYDDPAIGIIWPEGPHQLSDKDRNARLLKDADVFD